MNSSKDAEPAVAGETPNPESRSLRVLGDMQKGITMAQIAKAAGVSQGAISSLLNDRDYGIRVSEKTRERVFKVCRDMGYIPNDLRAVVRMYPEVGEFCLLLASSITEGVSEPFVARLVQAAMTAITDPSRPITLAFYDPDKEYATGNIEDLPYPVRSGVASKFLFHGPGNVSLIQQIVRRGLPIVSLGSNINLPGVISMVPDYPAASKLAFEHLFKHGHRSIGIVSGPFGATESHIIDLHRGIRTACAEMSITIEAQNIVYGDLSYGAGMRAYEEFSKHPVPPTGIFCLSDAAAAGVISKAHHMGKKIPTDLSVIGCSDDFCSHLILPEMTTIHLPAEEMAQRGVQEITRLLQDSVTLEPRQHIIPVSLIERGSCGPLQTA